MASATHVTIRKRVALFFLFVSVIMIGLGCRLMYLQFYRSGWLSENALDQRIRDIPVEAKRGMIYDRNGKELAVSMSTDSVYAIPAEIRNADETAAKLAAILALDERKLAAQLKRRQAFTWVKRRINQEVAQEITKLDLPGIGLTQEGRRYYPYDNLAAHILGFTGIDSQGLDGVEMTFDHYLKGRPGSIVVEYDARGQEIPYASHKFSAPTEGNDIYLTIDAVIQQIIERELDKVMQETQAQGATIIVMQPKTGEILALASRPDYNPNKFAEYPAKLWRNVAVSNAYEPGSTFKILTTTAALGDQVVRPEEQFFDPGGIEVQGRTIHCWKHGGHGSQTFRQVVENSCNVGFVTVGLRLGKDRFYEYLNDFGLGKTTGIDLPGESKGIMIDKNKVTPINIATMSMGQSVAVTPIQLLTAVSAVANDGLRLRPQILREVRNKNNEVIRSFQPDKLNQVIDANTAKLVKNILEGVVSKGSGRNAFIEGYRIAGKTGTAQKVGAGGYAAGKYIASFAGFAPADDPELAMLVIIDEPVGLYYGGQIAAPVFGAVMRDLLQYLKVASSAAPSQPGSEQSEHIIVPDLINMVAGDAVRELKKYSLTARVEENGERIADQIPKPGSRLPPGSTVLLYTVTPRYGNGEVTIPDCQGLSLGQASEMLAAVGLTIQPSGTGTVAVKQDPPAGSKALPGAHITIFFE